MITRGRKKKEAGKYRRVSGSLFREKGMMPVKKLGEAGLSQSKRRFTKEAKNRVHNQEWLMTWMGTIKKNAYKKPQVL